MESIAVIGMGCRFPGAPNIRAFWKLLTSSGDAITEVPSDRYDIDAYYDPHPATPGKVMSRYGGFLDHVDQFDAAFFGISPREAAKIDPQHRLLMEVAWEAIEDAGLVPASMTDEEKLNIACYMGVITGDYWDRQFSRATELDVYATCGSARSGAAGRISYSLDLKGTSFALDAACSSSLVAVDQAVHALRAGAYTTALAGGVNLILNPDHAIGFSQGSMMAKDGHCKTFDEAADGYVRSEGAGVVVLKLLSHAQADGDHIYAVISGNASNNDGHCDSFMAPSTQGQQAGLRKACRNAGIDPGSINYVEAHGPGTKAGDPVEITTLGEVLCQNRPTDQPLLVGSVKTNIGHTEGAAGVAGLIKVVLSLSHGMIPPNLHFHHPSSAIPWSRYALTVPTTLTPWPQYETPRRAVVCSYGIAGTNTYVVLEEAPVESTFSVSPQQAETVEALPEPSLLPLTARSPEALKALAQRAFEHFVDETYAQQYIQDICYTASQRRHHHDYRLTVIAQSKQDCADKLAAYLHGQAGLDVIEGQAHGGTPPKAVWIFPGQGSQWLGMGQQLLKQDPAFRETIEACDRVIGHYVNWSLIEQLQADEAHSRLQEINVVQPVLFSIEVALAALWRSWGIEPAAVIGHSMGEVAAAYVAGALSLEDAAWIICKRSELLLRTSGKGAMAAVELSFEEAQTLVSDYADRVSVAVNNSPHSTVLSGDPQALDEILTLLNRQGIFGRLVRVDVASHSPQMDSLHADLLHLMKRVQPRRASIPFYSTVTGTILEGPELTADYWVQNLRQPVLFLSATQLALSQGCQLFMEMSPHPLLVGAIKQTITQSHTSAQALGSLQRNEDERTALLSSLAHIFVQGGQPNWQALYPHGGQHVTLPTYPWQRQRHWNDKVDKRQSYISTTKGTLLHPILGPSTPSALHPQTVFWTTEIDTDRYPFLQEHCVHGLPVLPGAAYIELSLAAATEVFGEQSFRVDDLVLKKVLFFPKGVTQTLQITLTPGTEEGGMVLQFYSTQAGQDKQALSWTHHATALIRQNEEAPTRQAPHVLPKQDQEQKKWTLEMEASAFYERIRTRGIQHGPLFQGVTEIWRSPGEVMAHLSIPQDVVDDMPGYQIHPALMDAILQGIIPFLPAEQEEDTYVPVAIRQVQLHQKPAATGTLWSHATLTEAQDGTINGDVILLDEEGHVLLEVLGFRLQSLDGDTQGLMRQRLNRLVYTIQWEQQDLTAARRKGTPRKRWLLFHDHTESGRALTKRLQAGGAVCVLVTPAETTETTKPIYKKFHEQHYELNPTTPEGFHQLFADVSREEQPVDGIIYLWGMLTTPQEDANTKPVSVANHDLTSIGVLHLLQALMETKREITPRLYLVTNGVHAIEEQDTTTALAQSPMWGLGRVIVYEHQDLHCTLIDLDASPSEESLKALYQEVVSDNEDDEVAWRGLRRYSTRLTHHMLSTEQEPGKTLFRPDGTYLITGGLGGVGLRTAQWMIEQGARFLVLMGRQGPSEEAQAMLETMREAGTTINLMQVDVAQEAQLDAALDEIRRKCPPLHGVFHSAVVLDDSILLQLNRERFLSVMPPKVDGAWNLHRLTLEDPLDYFVLFSSAASLIGSPGQGNYAAANAFMDMLAWYRRQQGYPALCINWGRWGEVGQATKGNRGERLDARGFASMRPQEGLAILGELLRQSPPQIGVMSFDLPKWSQFYPMLASSSLFASLRQEIDQQTQKHNARSVLTREMLVELEVEQRLQALAHYLNTQIASVLGHTNLTLSTHQQLQRLGLDSLMSVELRNRISTDLAVTIPMVIFLQGTFGDLLTHILEQSNTLSGEGLIPTAVPRENRKEAKAKGAKSIKRSQHRFPMICNRKANPSDLTDTQWEILKPLIPAISPEAAYHIHERREIVNAILYVLRSGCSWRMLPHEFPAWRTVYSYFRQWQRAGIWDQVLKTLRMQDRKKEDRDPEPSAAVI